MRKASTCFSPGPAQRWSFFQKYLKKKKNQILGQTVLVYGHLESYPDSFYCMNMETALHTSIYVSCRYVVFLLKQEKVYNI